MNILFVPCIFTFGHLPVVSYLNEAIFPERSELNLVFYPKVFLILSTSIVLSHMSYR